MASLPTWLETVERTFSSSGRAAAFDAARYGFESRNDSQEANVRKVYINHPKDM
jgi:hypothetical protein